MARKGEGTAVDITRAVLGRLGLPRPGESDDKEARGRVLIVGGSREMPGAVILAGEAALRAGAGKLRIATVRSVAAEVATRIPEARVYHLPEARGGDIAPSAAEELAGLVEDVDAFCVGPGVIGEGAATRLMKRLLPRLPDKPFVLDANALAFLSDEEDAKGIRGRRAVLTPQAEEMATMLGEDKSVVAEDPERTARGAAKKFGVTVALKGRETFIASPGGRCYSNRAGNVGLATSGSGDVLAGLVTGLLARGADPPAAAAWGVHAHALAGDRLASKLARVGYLARELAGEIPAVLADLLGEGRR